MQIIVPAAGSGTRFAKLGYKDPKPLIKVLNKPLIKWSTDGLKTNDDIKFIFLVQQEHIDEFKIDKKLAEWYLNFEIVPVKSVTEGQACTALLAKDLLKMEDELAIVNCDNLFSIDLESAKNSLPINANSRGIIFYIAGNNPAWSYVATNEHGYATRTAEKIVISDKATVGCYYFTKARYFVEAAEKMIKKNVRFNNEFYVSPTYNIFINEGKAVHTWPCDFHISLGTPEQVERFTDLFKI